MGNICRSPTAEGVFKSIVSEQSLDEKIGVDSAGTYAYHAGDRPDSRARRAAEKRGYDLSAIRARKVSASDFENFDYVLAMDNENKLDLIELSEEEHQNKIKLFLEFSKNKKLKEVPDPYFGGLNGFEMVLDLVEEASKGLLEHIASQHSLKRKA